MFQVDGEVGADSERFESAGGGNGADLRGPAQGCVNGLSEHFNGDVATVARTVGFLVSDGSCTCKCVWSASCTTDTGYVQVSMVGQRVHHGAGSARVVSAGSNPWLDCEVIGSPDLTRKGGSRRDQTEEGVETHRRRGMAAGSRLCGHVGLVACEDRTCRHLLRSWTLLSLIYWSARYRLECRSLQRSSNLQLRASTVWAGRVRGKAQSNGN